MSVILDKNIAISDLKNRAVYKDVFNQFYKELVVYAHNFLFDQQSSEDIVQDIFIQLWENSHELEIHTSIRAYLYTTVRNKCFNYLRSLKIQDNINLLDFNNYLTTDNDLDVLERQEKLIVYDMVLRTVEHFPEGMKRIFTLKYLENYKYSEIAEELGISINSVKTQLKRAKIKISDAISIVVFLLGNYW
ncbi:RNA polymerase sigma-70 factor [Arenibacter sp. M-2]|uniref:RNA polymerase sigma-70 factor n=1 Tax=Arenibacter sp. M-2 TaxID=3053612 RepID=UPI00256FFEFF|nr:RNA polymerase sigma-70 factor [Arenibacter sp. M-2]MDL5513764.1 RNA polymerase sigma-70 factor [Arenibacter sp. M-2]